MLNVYMDDYLHAGAAGFWVLFLKRQTCKKVESAALLTRAQETLRLAKFEQDFSSDRSGCELSVNEEQAETSRSFVPELKSSPMTSHPPSSLPTMTAAHVYVGDIKTRSARIRRVSPTDSINFWR